MRADIGRVAGLLGGDVVHRAQDVALAANNAGVVRERLARRQRQAEVEDLGIVLPA